MQTPIYLEQRRIQATRLQTYLSLDLVISGPTLWLRLAPTSEEVTARKEECGAGDCGDRFRLTLSDALPLQNVTIYFQGCFELQKTFLCYMHTIEQIHISPFGSTYSPAFIRQRGLLQSQSSRQTLDPRQPFDVSKHAARWYLHAFFSHS